jgi:hypothetical protein
MKAQENTTKSPQFLFGQQISSFLRYTQQNPYFLPAFKNYAEVENLDLIESEFCPQILLILLAKQAEFDENQLDLKIQTRLNLSNLTDDFFC